jgi:PucR family transcriptional regulator, purine catabolism regulatory protein
MTVLNMLKIESLSSGKLIAGKEGVSNEISGVNVLEALDIENWGRQGEVILTSYFALQNLTDKDLELFFEKLHKVGISALIIKLQRLVHNIPSKIVELCDKHLIPLIQICKGVKYEAIILEILEPIINKNASLLNKYYKVHSELTSLALKMPSMDEILWEFKKMLQRDVSLINTVKQTEISTKAELCETVLLERSEVSKERYMEFCYERNKVAYTKATPNITGTQIRVQIPCLGFNDYELIIHEISNPINSEDFMILENAVKFLQMELLKKYVVSQNIYQQKNNIIGDLLNDRLYDKRDIDEVLESLNLDSCKYYKVIIIRLYQREDNKSLDKNQMAPILIKIRNIFRTHFSNSAFMEKSDRVVFLLNFDHVKTNLSAEFIDKLMQPLVAENLFKEYYYGISISSKAEKSDIPRANKEALDTQKILRLFHNSNTILPYEELGIYKLFLETNGLEELQKFVSPKINKFRLDYPELFNTLKIFLDANQSYTVTSEKLFLHQKTVRYRIDKIKDILGTELTNPEEILQIQIAARLFKLMV